MNGRTECSNNQITWEKIIEALILPRKRFRIRIVDTVFLHSINDECQITAWYLTTKKGGITKRKGSSGLTLQHVCDRFSRVALTGSNTAGPRIVAVGYFGNSLSRKRINFTAEQLEREVKSQKESQLARCSFLQCYLKPSHGNDRFFRGVYSCQYEPSISLENEDELKREVLVYSVEDPMIETDPESDICSIKLLRADGSALLKWIQQEVDMNTTKIVQALECFMRALEKKDGKKSSPLSDGWTISNLTTYFVFDNDKKLWLSFVNNVSFNGDDTWQRVSNVNSSNDQGSFLPRLDNEKKLTSPVQLQRGHPTSTGGRMEKRYNNDLVGREEHRFRTEDERRIEGNDAGCSHTEEMAEEISRLKMELNVKSQARDEHVSTINKLRSKAESVLELNSSVTFERTGEKEQRDAENQVVDTQAMRQKCKKSLLDKSVGLESSIIVAESEKELKAARDDIKILQGAISDRGHHDRIINKLQNQCNELSKRLEDELFRKNEARRRMDSKGKDIKEALEKSNDRVHVLEVDLTSEKSRNEKAQGQLKTANKILEAELISQRDYVEEMRDSSWSELAAKVRAGIEAVTSQELAKSSLGVTKAVSACEERWKRRLMELDLNHAKEIVKFKEDHKNELRYNNSQFQIQLEQGRVDVEERLQKNHTDSMRATLSHKESQKQMHVKQEIKRWEQMMSEMKARMHSEYQQSNQRLIKEKDDHWKTKLNQEANVSEAKLEEEREKYRQLLEAALEQNKKDVNSALDQADKEHKSAMDVALAEADERWTETLKKKKQVLDAAWQEEKDAIIEKGKADSATKTSQAVEHERQHVHKLSKSIALLKSDHEEEKQKLIELVEHTSNETETLKRSMTREQELQGTKEAEDEISKIKDACESRLAEVAAVHDANMSALMADSNKTISAELESAKQGSMEEMKDAISTIELDHEDQIQSLEYEIGWLKSQKETSDVSLTDARNKLQQRVELIEAVEEERRAERVEHSYHKLFIVTKSLQLKKKLESSADSYAVNVDQVQNSHMEVENQLKSKMEKLQKMNSKLEGNLKLISSTLLNHKRDALVEHKTKSREIATNISEISQKKDAAEVQQQKMNAHIDNLVEAMHDVEKQLQDHAQTSALQGGKVNISHTRKKRRLDEEYEQILCKIELKRDGLNAVDNETKKLHTEKSEANDEMRKLEKSLVKLLVEQQKILLSISSRT